MSQLAGKYESFRPLIIWLGLTELAWIGYWLLRTGGTPHFYTITVVIWIIAMLSWLLLVIYAGHRGFFLKHTRWLSNIVGLTIVVAFTTVVFASVPAAREGLASAATVTTHRELASIHILRLLAIGTIIKYLQRELPLHFVIWGSLPDLLFAISAVAVTFLVGSDNFGREFFLVWHFVGFFAFLGAGVSMFFSMPSPLRIYNDQPDTSLVFKYPMLIAPNFTVPLFMLAHAFAFVKLFDSPIVG